MSDIHILFQNEDFIAVDKPSGISVHNNEDPENLLKTLGQKFSKLYPVHRLDKETSGIQVLALNEIAAKNLATEFQNKSVQKIYVGIMRGVLKHPEGTWNQSLTDKAEGRNNPAGQSKDRILCETRFRTLESSKYFTYCEFNLITGRQHQIRKHAALTNHALVGDPRYGEQNYNRKIFDLYKMGRMFLHCRVLSISGIKIESSVPLSFAEILKS